MLQSMVERADVPLPGHPLSSSGCDDADGAYGTASRSDVQVARNNHGRPEPTCLRRTLPFLPVRSIRYFSGNIWHDRDQRR